jgi:hypothetical protein
MDYVNNNLLVCDLTSDNTESAVVIVPMKRKSASAAASPTESA